MMSSRSLGAFIWTLIRSSGLFALLAASALSSCVSTEDLFNTSKSLSLSAGGAYEGCTSGTLLTPTSVQIGFTFPSDATAVNVYRDGSLIYTATSANFLTHTDSDLTIGRTYRYQCEAMTTTGLPVLGQQAQVLTPTVGFTFTGIATAENIDAAQIRVTWSKAQKLANSVLPNVKGYTVYLVNPGTMELTAVKTITNVNTTSTIIKAPLYTFTPNSLYTFRVRAFDADLTPNYDSNTIDATAFTYAGITSASINSSLQVVLGFPAVDDSDNTVNVYCKRSTETWSDAHYVGRVQSNTNSITLAQSAAGPWQDGIMYTCRARAVFGSSEDTNEAVRTFSFSSGDPFVTRNYSGCKPEGSGTDYSQVIDTTSVRVRFDFPSSASSVNVYRNGTLIGSSSSASTPVVDTGLVAGNTYRYTCEAVGASNDRLTGRNEVSLTPSINLDFGGATLVENLTGTSARVSWTSGNSSVKGYTIYQSLNAGNTLIPIADVDRDRTSYTIPNGLTPGSIVYFRVRAFNSSGQHELNSVDQAAYMYPGVTSAVVNAATSATVAFSVPDRADKIILSCRAAGAATWVPIYDSSTASPAPDLSTLSSIAYDQFESGVEQTCRVRAIATTVVGTVMDSNSAMVKFTPVGAADHFDFATQPPATVTAGVTFPVKVQIRDNYGTSGGNIVVAGADSSVPVTLSLSPANGLYGVSTLSLTRGEREFSLNVHTAGVYVLTASMTRSTDGETITGSTSTFTVTPATPVPEKSTISSSLASVTADFLNSAENQTNVTTLSIILKDTYGNIYKAVGPSMANDFPAGSTSFSTPVLNASTGTWTCKFRSSKAGSVSITDNTSGKTITLPITPNQPHHLAFLQQPSDNNGSLLISNSNGLGMIKVLVQDANNNTVTDYTDPVVLGIVNDPNAVGGVNVSSLACIPGTSGCIDAGGGAVRTSAVAGVATYNGNVRITKTSPSSSCTPDSSGCFTIFATSGSMAITSSPFYVEAGAATQLAFRGESASLNPATFYNLDAGTCSPAMMIQSQNASGDPANFSQAGPYNFALRATLNGITGGTFYSDPGCTAGKELTFATIPADGRLSQKFYFKTSQVGAWNILVGSGSEPTSSQVRWVPSTTWVLNTTRPPTVAVSGPSKLFANSGATVTYTITYSAGTSFNLASDGVSLNTTGTATCGSVGVANGDTDTPKVSLTNCTGNGTVGITIGAGTASNAFNLPSYASAASSAFTVDNVAPNSATALAWSQSSPFSGTAVNPSWTKSSSTDLENQKIQYYSDGSCTTVSGALLSLSSNSLQTAAFTGSDGVTYSYKITSIDQAGNSTISSCSSAITIDTTNPTLTITSPTLLSVINLASNRTNYSITGTCSEKSLAVNVSATDGSNTVTAGSQPTCSASGTFSTTIDINTLADGGVTFNASQTDLAGNTGSASVSNVSKDTVAPTVAIGEPSLAYANSAKTITYAITFSGGNSYSLDSSKIALNTTAGATCSKSVSGGTTVSPTVTLSNCTGNGTVGITIAASSAFDTAQNPNPASSPSTVFTVDNIPPTVSIAAPTASFAKSSTSVSFAVTYSGASNFSLTTAGVSKIATGTADCSGLTVSNGNTANPTVTLSNCIGDGTMGISIAAATASDLAGNTSTASAASSIFVVDNTAPTVTSMTTNASIPTFVVSFSEPIQAFPSSAIVELGTTSACSWSITPLIGPSSSYTLAAPASCGYARGTGTVLPTIPAGNVLDRAGNGTTAIAKPAAFSFLDATYGSVSFANKTGSVKEGTNTAITVNLSAPKLYDLTVYYTIMSASTTGAANIATSDDISPSGSGSIVIPAGQASADINFTAPVSGSPVTKIHQIALAGTNSNNITVGVTQVHRLVIQPKDLDKFIFVRASGDSTNRYTCGLTAKGAVYCWGSNNYGQLGNGSTTNSNSPQLVNGLDGSTYSAAAATLSVGKFHACVITGSVSGSTQTPFDTTNGGTLKCWGYNSTGQVGNGTTTTAKTPVSIGTGYLAVSAGSTHSCAIKKVTSGSNLFCWGENTYGNLGDGTSSQRNSPVVVTDASSDNQYLSTLSSGVSLGIAAGSASTCGITTTGNLKCWGAAANGRLGNGTTTPNVYSAPITPIGTNYQMVVGGGAYFCGLVSTGTLNCWGYNAAGQLGDGTTADKTVPTAIFNPNNEIFAWVGQASWDASASNGNTCAITTTGTLRCWGIGSAGQLGNGKFTSFNSPQAVEPGVSYSTVSAGNNHTCAVTSSGVAQCWGANDDGQLGNGRNNNDTITANKSVIDSNTSYQSVATGFMSACAITSDQKLKCWGDNTRSSLGDGGTTWHVAPSLVLPATNDAFIKVAVSQNGTTTSSGLAWACGISTSGALRCWGYNASGQTGNGGTSDLSVPTDIDSGTTYKDIAISSGHSCAITTAGIVKCWGANSSGQLGDNTTTARTTPVRVYDSPGTTTLYSKIAVSNSSTCAITTSGVLRCWGSTASGQLGNNLTAGTIKIPTDSEAVPQQYAEISGGEQHYCAIRADDGTSNAKTLWCWGNQGYGRVGNGYTSQTDASLANPTQIGGSGTTWSKVSVAGIMSCAVSTANDLYCWGGGPTKGSSYIALGDGTTSVRGTPFKIDSDIRDVAVGSSDWYWWNGWKYQMWGRACSLSTSGALKCWGSTYTYQAGDGILNDTTAGANPAFPGYHYNLPQSIW